MAHVRMPCYIVCHIHDHGYPGMYVDSISTRGHVYKHVYGHICALATVSAILHRHNSQHRSHMEGSYLVAGRMPCSLPPEIIRFFNITIAIIIITSLHAGKNKKNEYKSSHHPPLHLHPPTMTPPHNYK